MNVAIVLGNRLNDDGSLSKIGLDRLQMLKDADRAYRFDRIILSGGIPNLLAGRSEARAMFNVLEKDMQDRCILEQESLKTKENALCSIPIALELEPSRIVVITSPEHLDRWYLNPIRLFRKTLRRSKAAGVEMVFYRP